MTMTHIEKLKNLVPWAEATAPKLTAMDWWRIEWTLSTKGKRREDMPNGRAFSNEECRALLAYRPRKRWSP